jgi:WD40 repeat protein
MHRFERYDANGDAWLSYEDALRWEGFVQDSLGVEPLLLQSECNPGACVPLLPSAGRLPPNFRWSRPCQGSDSTAATLFTLAAPSTHFLLPAPLVAFNEFIGYRMRRIQAAQGVSLGDFRLLHQDMLRRIAERGGVMATGEAIHEAIERHIFVQHGYQYPELDPAGLAELQVEATGSGGGGGVCPSVTHFIGERVSVCRMARNRGPHGGAELCVAAGTAGEAVNHLHVGWLVASQRPGLPRVLPGGGFGPVGAAERGPLGGACIPYHHGNVMDVQFAPSTAMDGAMTLASAGSDGAVCLHQWQSPEAGYATSSPVGMHVGAVNSLAWNPNPGRQNLLLSGGDDGRVALYDVAQANCPVVLSNSKGGGEESTGVESVLWHAQQPDQVLVATSGEGLKLFDLRQGFEHSTRIFRLDTVVPIFSIAAEGDRVITGCGDGRVVVLDMRMMAASMQPDAGTADAGLLASRLHASQVPVWSVAMRPGGQFYSAGADGRVMQHGERSWKLADTYNLSVNSLDLQRQSDLMVAGSDAEELQFFHLLGQREMTIDQNTNHAVAEV